MGRFTRPSSVGGLTMKKLLLIGAALAALIGPAMAADQAVRVYRRPVYVPVPSWTGFYLGGNVGGWWDRNNSVTTLSAPVTDFVAPYAANSALGASGIVPLGNRGSFIGGAQAGYNYQLGSALVAGFETDLQGIATNSKSGVLATSVGPFSFAGVPEVITTAINSSRKVDWLGTVRGRAGVLVTPTLLAYGTGGLAYGHVSVNTTIAQANNDCTLVPFACLTPATGTIGTFSQTRYGWTVGAGAEWMFTGNWSAKLEYLYYDLGSVTLSNGALVTTNGTAPVFFGPSIVASQSSTRFSGSIVRAGLNYQFH
jgi:outer membrane immunogenic protein